MARNFNGTTAKVKTATGGLNFSGAVTYAILCKTSSGDGNWRSLGCLDNGSAGSANVKLLSLELGGSGATANATRIGPDGATSFEVASPWTTVAADGWCLHVGSHPGGTALGRLHRYKYSTAAFNHANTSSSYTGGSAPGASGRAELGGDLNGAGDWFPGDIAIAAYWNRVLSDAEVESLPFTLQAWFASSPVALWLLDQSATGQKIGDLTGGGADEASLTATTVSTSSVPVFNYTDGIWIPTIVTPAAGGGSTYTTTGSVVAGSVSTGADAYVSVETVFLAAGSASSGGDAYTAAETGAVTVSGFASGVDAYTPTETGALIAGTATSGADVYTAAETGALIAAALLSGADVAARAETGVLIAGALVSGADVYISAETGTITTGGLISGVESTAGGTTSQKAGSLLAGGLLSAADAATHAETAALIAGALTGGGDVRIASETGALIAAAFLAGADVRIAVEAGVLTASVLLAGTPDTAPPVTRFFGRPNPGGAELVGTLAALTFGKPNPRRNG